MAQLAPDRPRGTEALRTVLHKAFEDLNDQVTDRRFGQDVDALRHVLCVGWAQDALPATNDAPSHQAPETP